MSVRRELGGVPRAWGQITALCSDLPGMGWVCPFPASFERPRVPAEGPRVCRGTFTQHMQRGLYGEISELKFYHGCISKAAKTYAVSLLILHIV